jgi:hypothetical protein
MGWVGVGGVVCPVGEEGLVEGQRDGGGEGEREGGLEGRGFLVVAFRALEHLSYALYACLLF